MGIGILLVLGLTNFGLTILLGQIIFVLSQAQFSSIQPNPGPQAKVLATTQKKKDETCPLILDTHHHQSVSSCKNPIDI